MDINTLITHYGYAALVIGSMAEGETVTLLGRRGASGIAQVSAGGGGCRAGRDDGRSATLSVRTMLWREDPASFPPLSYEDSSRAENDPTPSVSVCDRHAFYVRLPGGWPLLIGASRLPPKIFLPLNIVGALIWALLFTTLGYLGGEVIAPWLHDLDQHLRHGVWLILAIVTVVGVRWWLKRRGKAEAR